MEEGTAHVARAINRLQIDFCNTFAHDLLTRFGTDSTILRRPRSVNAGSKDSSTSGNIPMTRDTASTFPSPTVGSPCSSRLTASTLTPAHSASSRTVMPSMRRHVERCSPTRSVDLAMTGDMCLCCFFTTYISLPRLVEVRADTRRVPSDCAAINRTSNMR